MTHFIIEMNNVFWLEVGFLKALAANPPGITQGYQFHLPVKTSSASEDAIFTLDHCISDISKALDLLKTDLLTVGLPVISAFHIYFLALDFQFHGSLTHLGQTGLSALNVKKKHSYLILSLSLCHLLSYFICQLKY